MEKIKYFQDKILIWYNFNKRDFPWRRKTSSNYKRIISEFLLKRTTAKSDSDLYYKFTNKYPNWKALSNITETELQEDLKPIGLWKQRAKSLKDLSKEMIKRNGKFPNQRKDLEALPGIGLYIASSILLFYFKQKEPLLDSNMARVIQRYTGLKTSNNISADKELYKIACDFVNVDDPIAINWSILDFSAKVCNYRLPDCNNCPLTLECSYFCYKDNYDE